MKLPRLRQKRKQDDELETLPPRRRRGDESKTKANESFRIGRTIAGESRQKRQAELERADEHKRQNRKKRIIITLVVGFLLILSFLLLKIFMQVAADREAERLTTEAQALTPTVDIVDENRSESVSSRVTEFVARLEQDAARYGLEVDHVVLPFQKAREVRVYLKNHDEYFKMTIDRSSAVQAEDMSRMVQYLYSRNIDCEYVDLRVEGRAYYK